MLYPYKANSNISPYPPSCLDIETASTGYVLGIGFSYSDENDKPCYSCYDNWSSFFDDFLYIYEKQSKPMRERLTTIYAHNGVKFDWLSLIQWAEDSKIIDECIYIPSGSGGISVKLVIKNVVLILRDSFNILNSSLSSLCSHFGVSSQKLDVPDDYISRMEDYKRDFPDHFWLYLEHDVLGLQQVLFTFWSQLYSTLGRIGELPLTQPSLALKLFRMTLDKPMYPPTDAELKEFERLAYTGGRTETYRPYAGSIRVYDANSMYPSQMVTQLFPLSKRGCWVTKYRGKHGIYEIEFNQTNRFYKPLLRDLVSGKFLYKGSGVYTKPEIDKILELGEISVIRGYEYFEVGKIFEPFITYWYKQRLEAKRSGDEAWSFVCKILMNSLYGKFGQREEGTIIEHSSDGIISDLEESLNNGEDVGVRLLGKFIEVEEIREVGSVFCAIAAYVTAYARLDLFSKMCLVADAGEYLIGVDTDAIQVPDTFVMPTGDNLGEWDLEIATGRIATIGKKTYSIEGEVIKAKGIGKMDRSELTHDDFERMVSDGSSTIVSFRVFPSPREVISGKKRSCQAFRRERRIRPTAEDTSTFF